MCMLQHEINASNQAALCVYEVFSARFQTSGLALLGTIYFLNLLVSSKTLPYCEARYVPTNSDCRIHVNNSKLIPVLQALIKVQQTFVGMGFGASGLL